jgi:hypothetical protein
VPPQAYRVHISDDDFACDRDRARGFFERLRSTPFRLSSCQVSIADLCRKVDGKVLAEADVGLLDAIRPDCFADAGAAVPLRDFVADHRSRAWSSFLQVGVESYADAELVRLGKGYRREHVRAIAAELARRELHWDGYFILSNGDTRADDLIEVLDEVCRLKIRYPTWFHVRFPVVPRLVSYFPSASHRRRVRQGTTDVLVLRGHARIAGHPEFDYPFVDHDASRDEWVNSAVEQGFFTDDRLYLGALDRLADLWRARWSEAGPGEARRRGERLLRRLDDRPRRLVFDVLEAVRVGSGDGAPDPSAARVRATAEGLLGPAERWLRAFARHVSEGARTLTVILERGGVASSRETLERSIDLLLSTDRAQGVLQLDLGQSGDPERICEAVAYARSRAGERGQQIAVVGLCEASSLDAQRWRSLQAWACPVEVTWEVVPTALDGMLDELVRVVDLGVTRIRVEAGAIPWTSSEKQRFASGLHQIGLELIRRGAAGVIQRPARALPAIAVDVDGTITAGPATRLGHLDECGAFERYFMDAPACGAPWSHAILESFLAWMQLSVR